MIDQDQLPEAIVPTGRVRAEIEARLQQDDTTLGDVWRRLQSGESPQQIKEARGLLNSSFVSHYRRTCDALLDGVLPTAPTVANAAAIAFRRFLRDADLSSETRALLQSNLAILEQRASDEVARQVEDREALHATAVAESEDLQGIYVYALPHYLRHPYDEESDRTLMKIGSSRTSVIRRFIDQKRTTALPEEPVLLRIYLTAGDEALIRERQFHGLLEAADHTRSRARTAGTEWFLTSLRFLDAIAATVGLETRNVYEPGATD